MQDVTAPHDIHHAGQHVLIQRVAYRYALSAELIDAAACFQPHDRIIRDHKYRGMSALDTIRRWPSVRRGEDKWILPFHENADAMFNSSLLFELSVIKNYALPILEQVPSSTPEYAEASRLIKFLTYFEPLDEKDIPSTSLLREFLGGSSFHY